MNLIQKLKNKYLQVEQKVKQRTHAIDLLVSGQTAANQRSLANKRNIKELCDKMHDLQTVVYGDIRNKFRYTNGELQEAKRSILWLKAWIFGLTIFNIVMALWFTMQMF